VKSEVRNLRYGKRQGLVPGALALVIVLLGTALPHVASACSACYGASDSPLAQGMNMGILVLLGFIGVVLAGITAFFFFIARQSARFAASAPTAPISTDTQT
jgi:hypothetical protein